MSKLSRVAHVSRQKVKVFDYLRGRQGLLLFKTISKNFKQKLLQGVYENQVFYFATTHRRWLEIHFDVKNTQKLLLLNTIRFLVAFSVFFLTHIQKVWALNETNFLKFKCSANWTANRLDTFKYDLHILLESKKTNLCVETNSETGWRRHRKTLKRTCWDVLSEILTCNAEEVIT